MCHNHTPSLSPLSTYLTYGAVGGTIAILVKFGITIGFQSSGEIVPVLIVATALGGAVAGVTFAALQQARYTTDL